MLHTSLEANDNYSWRRLPGQSKYDIEQRVVGTDHLDVHLHFADGNPRHENAGEKNHITGKRVDGLLTK